MFEKASRLKLRITSHRGPLAVEDLWDVPLTELNRMAKALNKLLKTEEEEDFLKVEKKEAGIIKLKFDLVLHVLQTKQEDNQKALDAKSRKEMKQKVLAVIEKKKDGDLEGKSVEELMEGLEKLD